MADLVAGRYLFPSSISEQQLNRYTLRDSVLSFLILPFPACYEFHLIFLIDLIFIASFSTKLLECRPTEKILLYLSNFYRNECPLADPGTAPTYRFFFIVPAISKSFRKALQQLWMYWHIRPSCLLSRICILVNLAILK